MEDMWKHLGVAALEFGTTNSCIVYSMRNEFETDPLNIYICYLPGSLSETPPTCLLLDKEKQFMAFGYDAVHRYAELVMDEKQDDYYFFDRFTLSLHNNENVTRDMVLKDKTGKKCPAVEVFTLSIKYVVDHFMECLKIKYPELRVEDIVHGMLWVLTVSAAWTDSAKQLMRESAEKAGINPEKVLLVNKPEASFTYCHYVSTTRLQGSKTGHMIKEPGTKSMVVDLGVMTADITVLQQTFDGQLKILCRVIGDDCGGASVDDRLYNVIEEIVGGNVIAELKRQHPCDWLDLIRIVRMKNESFSTSNTRAIVFKIPVALSEIYEKLHGKDLKSAIHSSSYVNEITTCPTPDKLRFKVDFMIKLFTPTIDSIITLMKNTVSNGLSNIIMVGGFSVCPMIQEAVCKAFPDNQIIIPCNPGLSGLTGAVLFGHQPDYIWSELRDEEGIGK